MSISVTVAITAAATLFNHINLESLIFYSFLKVLEVFSIGLLKVIRLCMLADLVQIFVENCLHLSKYLFLLYLFLGPSNTATTKTSGCIIQHQLHLLIINSVNHLLGLVLVPQILDSFRIYTSLGHVFFHLLLLGLSSGRYSKLILAIIGQ